MLPLPNANLTQVFGADPSLLVAGAIVFTPTRAGVPERPTPVALCLGATDTLRAQSQRPGERRLPGNSDCMGRCHSLCPMGRETVAHRSRVGICARGGQEGLPLVWGKTLTRKTSGTPTFAGGFPYQNALEDGHYDTL